MSGTYGFPYVVGQVSSRLVERLVGTGIVLADQGAIGFGRDRLAEELSAPRVVIVPKGGPFGPRDVAGPSNALAAKLQRARASRQATGEVHCWGRTYEEAELLCDQLCNALFDVAVGQIALSGAQWAEETRVLQSGQEIVFGFSVVIPIVDGPVPLAPVGTKGADEGHIVLPTGSDTQAC